MASAAPPRGAEYKVLRFDRAGIKAVAGDAREFTGYAAAFTLDQGGDRIRPGAFLKTLRDRTHRPLVWQHDTALPIGKEISLTEDHFGLKGTWRISDTPKGREAYTLLKDGAISGMSIGYFPTVTRDGPDGTRELLEIDLREISIVTLGMNEDAQILSVKSGGGPAMSVAARMAARGLDPLPFPPQPQTIGERISQSPELKAFLEGRARVAKISLDGIGHKNLVNGISTGLDLRTDLTELPPVALTLPDLLPTYPTQSNRVSVPRVGSVTNNAAPVAEATASTGASGSKPESALTFVDGTLPVQVVAHFVNVTRSLFDDLGEAQMVIQTELLVGLRQAVENQVLNGTGANPQLAGILGLPGIGTVAVSATNYVGAVLAAIAQVRSASKRAASVAVLSPTAWTAVASGAAPGLLGTSPRGLPTLLGVEVVQSDYLPATTGLVGAAATAPILERQAAEIRIGTVNDGFLRNILVMLAEVRLALAVSRQNAWVKVTGLP